MQRPAETTPSALLLVPCLCVCHSTSQCNTLPNTATYFIRLPHTQTHSNTLLYSCLARVHARSFSHARASVFLEICTRTRTRTRTRTHACVHTHTRTHAHTHKCTHAHTHTRTYSRIKHTRAHARGVRLNKSTKQV